MGYIKDIKPNTNDSHQMSPGYCLTFLRFSNRDTFNYDGSTLGKGGGKATALETRRPLVVYSDAIQVIVSNTKSSISPTVTMVLKGGDINYSTAVNTGDFVLVNLLTWEKDAERIRNKAVALQPINEINDGFKGVFKVQSVVKGLSVDTESGIRTVTFTITAAGFTEFNNVIYYNPAIVNAFATEGTLLYQSSISENFASLIKSRNDIDYLMKILIKVLIGEPVKSTTKEIDDYGNNQFQLPPTLGKLLGKPSAKYASDLFDYIVGIWGNSKKDNTSNDMVKGFNPGFVKDSADNFWKTDKPVLGNKQVDIGDWNSNTAWSLLNGYLNDTINEMYTTYRITPSGKVQPTVIIRQKPFTTSHFKFTSPTDMALTRYMELPRWRISSDLMLSLQTAKNDSFRFNFVQLFTRSIPDASIQAIDQAQQIAMKNFVADENDIKRHGLKPYVKTSNFDFPGTDKPDKRLRAKEWSEMLADWVLDLHLKETGTVSFVGIQHPISVGDNLEVDGIIYHIEGITNTMTVMNSGKKKWITNLTLSYGIDVRSSTAGPVYSNMDHTDAHTKNIEDWNNEKILPGISDTQSIIGRTMGEELKNTKQQSFTPSNLRKKRTKAK